MVDSTSGLASYDAARDILDGLIGSRLTLVRYLMLLWSSARERSTDALDVLDEAIELTFDSGPIYLHWVMDADAGGIELYREALADVDPEYGELLDVSSDSQWSNRIGARVIRAGIAVHQPIDPRGIDAFGEWVWAVRLEFDDAPPVVIALGDLDQDENHLKTVPRFSPDNLLVLFSKEVAQSYQNETSKGSSWGDTVTR